MTRAASVEWALGAATALALGLAALAVELSLSGRARAPAEERASALAAYESASRGGAAAWAAAELSAARSELDAALLDESRQRARLALRRDYRGTRESLVRAREAAARAEQLAAERQAAALAEAEAALSGALELEQHALALAAATSLPHAERARLLRARLTLREAETLAQAGEPRAALARAQEAAAGLHRALGPSLEAAERYRSQGQVATWRGWIEETRRASRASGQPAIVVLKEKNVLVLLARGEPVRRYDAEVGRNALGVKRQKGDRATPEGRYRIVKKKDRGQSVYHRALLLDYPNAADRARFAEAKRRGQIPKGAAIGGLIEIHGDGGRGRNWTDGCVALANPDMDDLFARVGVGTRVTIVGGDGSDGAFSSLLSRLGQGEARP